MQTSSRGRILDQIQQAGSVAAGEPFLISTEHDSRTAASSQNSFVLLTATLRELMPTVSLDQLVHSLAAMARQALDMDLCLVMLADTLRSQLSIQATSPDLNGRLLAILPLVVEPALWKKLQMQSTPGQLPELTAIEREQLNPLKNVEYEHLHIVPLSAGLECIGLLCCYSSKARTLDMQEQLILQTIGSFAAMSIVSRQRIEAAASSVSVKCFFDDVLTMLVGDTALESVLRGRATALGCDYAQPHVMLAFEIARLFSDAAQSVDGAKRQEAYRHAIKLVEQRICARYPGSLFDEREHRLYGIVPQMGDDAARSLKMCLDTLVQQVESELHISLFAGVSAVCHSLSDYRGGFAEAEEALRIAQCLNARAASMHFSNLGAYRYVYAFASDHTRSDIYLEQIAVISRYDESHKRADLLNTLDVFLTRWGNIKEASELLDVHRNTLTQRLERIQSLCTIDLTQADHWLPLQIAIIVHRLRRK